MSSTNQGAITWIQPLLSGGTEELFVNGSPTGVELATFEFSTADEQGVVVRTASGQDVPHVVLESPDAPLPLARFDLELGWNHVAEDVRRLGHRLLALAWAGRLRIYMDHTTYDLWDGDGSRTIHVLSQSTGYGTTGISFVDRPARCFVTTGVTEVELTAVTGAPSPGEFEVSQTSDSTSIELGSAPAIGALTELVYYPLFRATGASYSESMSERNSWDVNLSFASFIPLRTY